MSGRGCGIRVARGLGLGAVTISVMGGRLRRPRQAAGRPYQRAHPHHPTGRRIVRHRHPRRRSRACPGVSSRPYRHRVRHRLPVDHRVHRTRRAALTITSRPTRSGAGNTSLRARAGHRQHGPAPLHAAQTLPRVPSAEGNTGCRFRRPHRTSTRIVRHPQN